jgi:hypothetical protein
MHLISDRRRRTPIPAVPAELGIAEEGWISLVGQGGGFHDCPLCRELGRHPEGAEAAEAAEAAPAIVGFRRESLPELMRAGWLDDLLELVGPNATVRVMGRAMEAEPVEVISIESFLARLGHE